MKLKHYLIVGLVLVGSLYAWHMYSTHGTFKQSLSGLGISR